MEQKQLKPLDDVFLNEMQTAIIGEFYTAVDTILTTKLPYFLSTFKFPDQGELEFMCIAFS